MRHNERERREIVDQGDAKTEKSVRENVKDLLSRKRAMLHKVPHSLKKCVSDCILYTALM